MHGLHRRTRHAAMPAFGVTTKHELHSDDLRQHHCSIQRRWKSWSRIKSEGAAAPGAGGGAAAAAASASSGSSSRKSLNHRLRNAGRVRPHVLGAHACGRGGRSAPGAAAKSIAPAASHSHAAGQRGRGRARRARRVSQRRNFSRGRPVPAAALAGARARGALEEACAPPQVASRLGQGQQRCEDAAKLVWAELRNEKLISGSTVAYTSACAAAAAAVGRVLHGCNAAHSAGRGRCAEMPRQQRKSYGARASGRCCSAETRRQSLGKRDAFPCVRQQRGVYES